MKCAIAKLKSCTFRPRQFRLSLFGLASMTHHQNGGSVHRAIQGLHTKATVFCLLFLVKKIVFSSNSLIVNYSSLPDRDRAGFIRTGGSKSPVVFRFGWIFLLSTPAVLIWAVVFQKWQVVLL